ncbi:MAG: hypothetical protein WC831_06045 [Parcubacteria group bacterium]|jgi:hypothetical protein
MIYPSVCERVEWVKHAFLVYILRSSASAFLLRKNPKSKNFPTLFWSCARRFFFKRKGKFFRFGTEIFPKFQGGSGAEAKLNFGKSSSLVVKPYKDS